MTNAKDWSAWEDHQPPVDPSAIPFHVTGKVETTNGALQPKLTKNFPQGINPAILLLTLTIEQVGDVGTTDVAFRDVRYDETVTKGQYTSVSIIDGEQAVDITVQNVSGRDQS